ncbi:hypothetical protein ACVILK_003517 [Bradyrhizobium embrapense]
MYELPRGRAKLYWLIDLFLSDHHDVRTFCSEFERSYNFEVDRAELSAEELVVFGGLFRKVVMYSRFEDDLMAYPAYVDGKQIKEAALAARARLS